MNSKQIVATPFRKGQRVFVFEYGEGRYVRSLGFDPTVNQHYVEVRIDERTKRIPSMLCFTYAPSGGLVRRWSLDERSIDLTYDPITLTYIGEPTWVVYSDAEGDKELFESGDTLHKDWEGNGVNFSMILTKWFRRLQGENIPLSEYYRDNINRWLDFGANENLPTRANEKLTTRVANR
jgi:hypothetical protein